MANYLQMHKKQAMIVLFARRTSSRRIACMLGVERKTVQRYRRQWESGELTALGAGGIAAAIAENGPQVPTGSEVAAGQKGPEVPTGSRSQAAAYHELIKEKLESGQHARSIHYDLTYECGIDIGYDSIKRYVRKLCDRHPELVTRLEFPPGDAAQLDFGEGALTKTASGRYRRPKLFIITLCASRKAYREVIWDEKLPTLLGCLERAFLHFGGVPATLIPDNPKTAVTDALWQDPTINKKFLLFCEHYGTVPLPCHPRSPEEKGLIENGVNYAQKMLAGRKFESLAAQNAFLTEWDERVADKRIHGTTKKQVAASFALEKPHLKPLPAEPYEHIELGQRVVHMDGRIEVLGAYYPVPETHLGRRVEVRFNDRLVRIHDLKDDHQIGVHARQPPGRTAPRTFPIRREVPTSRAAFEAQARRRAEALGPDVGAFAEFAIERRGPMAYRFLQSLATLDKNFGPAVLAAAARDALATGVVSYRPFVSLCERHAAQRSLDLDWVQDHTAIRPLSEYASLVL